MIKPIVRKSRGQSMLEFALILPILLIFIMMVLDLGRLLFYYSTITNAVREGARYGIIHPGDDADIRSRVHEYSVGIGPAEYGVTYFVNVNYDDATSPTAVIVEATYTFVPITSVAAWITGGQTYDISSQATMHIEGAN